MSKIKPQPYPKQESQLPNLFMSWFCSAKKKSHLFIHAIINLKEDVHILMGAMPIAHVGFFIMFSNMVLLAITILDHIFQLDGTTLQSVLKGSPDKK